MEEGEQEFAFDSNGEGEKGKKSSVLRKKKLKKIEKELFKKIPSTFDGYEVEMLIGQGGMGAILLAWEKDLEREVAIKLLLDVYDPDTVERFLQEAKIISSLHHPHIIEVYNYGTVESHPYFAMEHIRGISLSDLIRDFSSLKISQVIDIVTQIGDAISYAHDQGIYHRDLKPSNIMISPQGEVRVLDFGLAKVRSMTTKLTQTGVVLGTPFYMAPEQGQGKAIDHRSDLYSLGVILFEMMTGQLPFQGETPMVVIYNHISTSPPSPRELNPHLPSWLEEIILRCLRKDPDNRYSSVAEFCEILKRSYHKSEQKKTSKMVSIEQDDSSKEDKEKEDSGLDFFALYQEKEEELGLRPTEAIFRGGFFFRLFEALSHAEPSTLLNLVNQFLFDGTTPEEERDQIITYICELQERNLLLIMAGLLDNEEQITKEQREKIEKALERVGL